MQEQQQMKAEKEMPLVANVCLLLTSLAGGALLIWWAVEFHQDNRQLWMVPFGLILAGTPFVVWFSLIASNALRGHQVLLLKPESHDNDDDDDDNDREKLKKNDDDDDDDKVQDPEK